MASEDDDRLNNRSLRIDRMLICKDKFRFYYTIMRCVRSRSSRGSTQSMLTAVAKFGIPLVAPRIAWALNRRRHAFQPNRIMHKIYIRFIRCCVSLLSLNIKSRIRIDASRYGTDGCKRVCRGVETERRSWYETTQRIAGINIEIDEYHSISEFGL